MMRNVSFNATSSFLVWMLRQQLGGRILQHCRPGPALKFAEQRRGHPVWSQSDDARGNYEL